jgi:serine/threonine protein kinase
VANPAVRRARFLAPGDKLGKHDLIRQIAVGGMAELYLARTTGIEGFEKLVVLKRILPQLANNASFVNMFLNEARLAATLHHPNIAQVFDIDQDGADYFFSMEYIHGQDLGHLVASAHESGVPISLDAALTLVAGLCAGLHYAHDKVGPDGQPLNVVHRDVSPSNVLVSYDGAVKLVDFGIARAGSNPATTRGGLKGKIAYMSPEQCRGKATLDRRSDIFSIGTILYELTTSQLPFTDETEYGVLNQIVNRDAEPPSRLIADYPPTLEAIVMRALARDPDQRYATALEMQKDLEDFAHENRLRISPLVIGRLMGSLYPTRLEEWDHARAQGAFFVEQHVVRTLIEGRKLDGSPESGPNDATAAPDHTSDTTVGPPPVEESTQIRPSGRARSPLPGMPQPTPLPGMPSPMAAPAQRASSPAIMAQRASSPVIMAQRASSPAIDPGLVPRRPSEPTMRAPTPTPGPPLPGMPPPVAQGMSSAPGLAQVPTPSPRMATPVPGQPGAVPIVTPYPMGVPYMPGVPMGGPHVAGAGTLVTNPSASGSNPAMVYPVASAGDVTERVRVPRAPVAPMMPVETTMVKIGGRSRTPLIVLLVTGLVAAGVAGVIVFGGKDNAAASQPAASGAPAVPPDPAKAEPAKAKADDPSATKAADPAKADPAKAKADDPSAGKADDPKADDPKADDPKADDPKADDPAKDPKNTKKTPKIVRQPPRVKQTRQTPPKKDPTKKVETKPDPEKDPKWTPDSPFMPVRPPDKK